MICSKAQTNVLCRERKKKEILIKGATAMAEDVMFYSTATESRGSAREL